MFLFFGVVAVTGSYYVQSEELTWEAFVLAVPVGLLASAILVVNNVRDLETDRRAGKRTLAVRLGRDRTRTLYARMLFVAFVTAPVPWMAGALSAWLLLPLAAPAAGRRSCAPSAPTPTGRRSTARSRHRDAAARLLRAAGGGAAVELMDVRVDRHAAPSPSRCGPPTGSCASASCCSCGSRRRRRGRLRRGGAARALRRRLAGRCAPRSTPTRRPARGDRARPPTCSSAAARADAPGARRDRPRAVGPRRHREGRPVAR